MTFDVDPDLWLFTRLTTRRWRWGWMAVVAIYALAMLFEWSDRPSTGFSQYNSPGNQSLAVISFLTLMVVGWSIVPAFAAAERNEQLDWTRLCGRPPHRVVLMLITGLTWPYLLIVAVMLGVNRTVFHGSLEVGWVGALLFAGTLTLALAVVRWLPDGTSPTVMLGLITWPAFVVAATALAFWDRFASFDWREQLAAGLILMTLPFTIHRAGSRLARPPNRANRWRLREITLTISRIVPRDGPAELLRQLRANVTSAAGLAVVLAAAMTALVGIRWTPQPGVGLAVLFLTAAPHLTVFVGALAVLATVGQEIESRTIDLVRLTPQSPESVVLGWYTGTMLPFWALALLLALTFTRAAPDFFATLPPAPWWRWLAAFGLPLPAILLTDALRRRLRGAWILGAFVAWNFANLYVSEEGIRSVATIRPLADIVVTPWHLNLQVLFLASATVIALGGACGLMRLAEGPALVGPAALAAIAAVTLAVRMVPIYTYPRVVAGLLPLLAGFLAEERERLTPPWSRVGVAATGALVAVSIVTSEAGLGIAVSVVTGIATALTMAIGLLGHELLQRRPVISAALPPALMFAVLRFPRTFDGSQTPPAFFETRDVMALFGACMVVAWVHARRRARAAADVGVA